MALSLALCGFGAAALAQGEPIRIGFLSSFTGPANQSGFNGIIGVKQAVKEINAAGGVGGRQLVIVQGDDQSDPTAAVNEARRLTTREKVDFIIGPIASQLTLATAPVLNEAKVGSVSVSGSAAITPAVAPYHFSILPSSDAQAEAISTHLMNVSKVKSVAILHDAGAQAKGVVESLRRELGKRRIDLKGVQEYDLQGTDMTPQLLSLRRTKPEALVLIAAGGNDTGNVLRNLGELDWTIPVVGNISVISQPAVVIKIAGAEAYKNVVGLNFKSLTYCSGDAIGSSDYARFTARLKAADPDGFPKYSPMIAAYTYDGVYAFKAFVDATKKTDGPSFAAWMEKHAASARVINAPLFASPTNHFMIGANALTMTENPDKPRADTLQKRAGCQEVSGGPAGRAQPRRAPADMPPSTISSVPVQYEASSDAR